MLVLLLVGWAVAGLLGVGAAVAFHDDDLWCEHETGESDYGDASWSWWPLGIRCTWTQPANLVTDEEDPPWGPTVLTALYLSVGVGLALAARAHADRRHASEP